MAVQAQCSSNFLLLNRNMQEGQNQFGNKYLLSPQPDGPPGCGGILDHQSINQTLFNNFPVGNYSTMNQRKREREDNNMNHFMSNNIHQQQQQQSHCSQFMDVSNMQSRNNVDVSTGLRLAFNDHHHQQCFDPQSSGFTYLLSDDFSNLINQQGNEIEHFIHAQGEELRRKLAEKRQRHYNALIVAAKESSSRMIREKEVEADKAIRHNAELEARASQLSAEAEIWQSKARAQEAVAAALQAQLQQAMGGCVSQGEEVGGDENVEDAESSYIDPERVVVVSGPGCKACGKRVASVVLLPCRHLCVCSECDDLVHSCPLCLSFRSSSIQVYMS